MIDFLLLILLEFLCERGIINEIILPSPTNILFESDFLNIFNSFVLTFKHVIIVFALALVLNMLIVLVIYLLDFKYLENVLYRINSIPRILITLIGIAILGVGYKTIGIVSIISSMPNFIITVLGYLRNNNWKSVIEAGTDCGATEFEILTLILIPSNIRGIIISIKILISNILNSIIIGEYLIGTQGIGSSLQYNLFMYDMKNVWMIALLLAVCSVVISCMFDFILNSKMFWFQYVNIYILNILI